MFQDIANSILENSHKKANLLAETLIKNCFDEDSSEDDALIAFKLIEKYHLKELVPHIISNMSAENRQEVLIERTRIKVDEISLQLIESLKNQISGRLFRILLRHFDNPKVLVYVAYAPIEFLQGASPQVLADIIKAQLNVNQE